MDDLAWIEGLTLTGNVFDKAGTKSTLLRNFAVLEGCDGSGTTTQLELLKKHFAGIPGIPPLFVTAEPTSGPAGVLIRRVLRGEISVTPETLARLFAADRGEHLYGPNGVAARCRNGELVVSDRYSLSSLVYQAIDCGPELPRNLNAPFPLPELLVYLDVDGETAAARIASRPEREIFEYLEFQNKVRSGYLGLLPVWEKAGVRVLSIDGTQNPEKIAGEIWSAVAEMPIIKRSL
jgi:dTMP kinase